MPGGKTNVGRVNPGQVSEQEAMEIAESSREKDVREPSFLKQLFLGRYRLDLLDVPLHRPPRPEFGEFYDKLHEFLRTRVDPAEIDQTGEYPSAVVDGLRKLGAFGMKIPKEYGGLGLLQTEYDAVMQLLGSYDANLTALLSAHQSIGVPQPLKLFGTDEQKRKFLPRLARGAISAFALTEPDVGSDPARLATTFVDAGDHYEINGEKLWCTNGTLAELIVVMARHKDTKKISAFIVDMSWPGVRVEHRCRFMGLRALGNAVISFTKVRVPKDHIIGSEGDGLKIALVTLNTGRLALPAAVAGTNKALLEICREWSNERVQWGKPIGQHEAIGHKLADMAAMTFAMEAVSRLAGSLADQVAYDIRIEAAAAKKYNTVYGWRLVDEAMQIRGGRGYETEASLAARGEPAIGVERAMRDARVNRIFEGSDEIMDLFIAREAVDKHLTIAGAFVNPKATPAEKRAALPQMLTFYATWYPSLYFGWSWWPKYGEYGRLAKYLRFAERSSRRLARNIFHGMVVHRARLQHKQVFLSRVVDIGLELFAMTASVLQAHQMRESNHANATDAARLAELFCLGAKRRIKQLFRALWHNDDVARYKLARSVLDGDFEWLETGKVETDESRNR